MLGWVNGIGFDGKTQFSYTLISPIVKKVTGFGTVETFK